MHPPDTKKKVKKQDDYNATRQPLVTRSKARLASDSSTATTAKDAPRQLVTRSKARVASDSSIATTAKDAPPSKLATSAKSKGKKRKRDDDMEYTPEDIPHNHAKDIVQQAWAQAVRLDVTFFVIHSGNYEIVCLRERESQTLYVSRLIQPHEYHEYGKLHIGIYIAAIQETIDRMKQTSKKEPPKRSKEDCSGSRHDKGGGSSREGRGHGGRRGVRGSGSRFQGSADQLVEVHCLPEQCQF
jgi:hypothetical protein